MPYLYYCLVFLVVSFNGGCSSAKKKAVSLKVTEPKVHLIKKYEKAANEKYKGDVSFVLNQKNSYVLCINRPKTTDKKTQGGLKFFI